MGKVEIFRRTTQSSLSHATWPLASSGEDRWVGGIESDISTVITYEAVRRWLGQDGTLAFFITGTVFANESSQGFRRWQLDDGSAQMRVIRVEGFDHLRPFDGISNHPALLIVRRDQPTTYPIEYWQWEAEPNRDAVIASVASGLRLSETTTATVYFAEPVPGSDAGPWLRGSQSDLVLWKSVFGLVRQATGPGKGSRRTAMESIGCASTGLITALQPLPTSRAPDARRELHDARDRLKRSTCSHYFGDAAYLDSKPRQTRTCKCSYLNEGCMEILTCPPTAQVCTSSFRPSALTWKLEGATGVTKEANPTGRYGRRGPTPSAPTRLFGGR